MFALSICSCVVDTPEPYDDVIIKEQILEDVTGESHRTAFHNHPSPTNIERVFLPLMNHNFIRIKSNNPRQS